MSYTNFIKKKNTLKQGKNRVLRVYNEGIAMSKPKNIRNFEKILNTAIQRLSGDIGGIPYSKMFVALDFNINTSDPKRSKEFLDKQKKQLDKLRKNVIAEFKKHPSLDPILLLNQYLDDQENQDLKAVLVIKILNNNTTKKYQEFLEEIYNKRSEKTQVPEILSNHSNHVEKKPTEFQLPNRIQQLINVSLLQFGAVDEVTGDIAVRLGYKKENNKNEINQLKDNLSKMREFVENHLEDLISYIKKMKFYDEDSQKFSLLKKLGEEKRYAEFIDRLLDNDLDIVLKNYGKKNEFTQQLIYYVKYREKITSLFKDKEEKKDQVNKKDQEEKPENEIEHKESKHDKKFTHEQIHLVKKLLNIGAYPTLFVGAQVLSGESIKRSLEGGATIFEKLINPVYENFSESVSFLEEMIVTGSSDMEYSHSLKLTAIPLVAAGIVAHIALSNYKLTEEIGKKIPGGPALLVGLFGLLVGQIDFANRIKKQMAEAAKTGKEFFAIQSKLLKDLKEQEKLTSQTIDGFQKQLNNIIEEKEKIQLQNLLLASKQNLIDFQKQYQQDLLEAHSHNVYANAQIQIAQEQKIWDFAKNATLQVLAMASTLFPPVAKVLTGFGVVVDFAIDHIFKPKVQEKYLLRHNHTKNNISIYIEPNGNTSRSLKSFLEQREEIGSLNTGHFSVEINSPKFIFKDSSSAEENARQMLSQIDGQYRVNIFFGDDNELEVARITSLYELPFLEKAERDIISAVDTLTCFINQLNQKIASEPSYFPPKIENLTPMINHLREQVIILLENYEHMQEQLNVKVRIENEANNRNQTVIDEHLRVMRILDNKINKLKVILNDPNNIKKSSSGQDKNEFEISGELLSNRSVDELELIYKAISETIDSPADFYQKLLDMAFMTKFNNNEKNKNIDYNSMEKIANKIDDFIKNNNTNNPERIEGSFRELWQRARTLIKDKTINKSKIQTNPSVNRHALRMGYQNLWHYVPPVLKENNKRKENEINAQFRELCSRLATFNRVLDLRNEKTFINNLVPEIEKLLLDIKAYEMTFKKNRLKYIGQDNDYVNNILILFKKSKNALIAIRNNEKHPDRDTARKTIGQLTKLILNKLVIRANDLSKVEKFIVNDIKKIQGLFEDAEMIKELVTDDDKTNLLNPVFKKIEDALTQLSKQHMYQNNSTLSNSLIGTIGELKINAYLNRQSPYLVDINQNDINKPEVSFELKSKALDNKLKNIKSKDIGIETDMEPGKIIVTLGRNGDIDFESLKQKLHPSNYKLQHGDVAPSIYFNMGAFKKFHFSTVLELTHSDVDEEGKKSQHTNSLWNLEQMALGLEMEVEALHKGIEKIKMKLWQEILLGLSQTNMDKILNKMTNIVRDKSFTKHIDQLKQSIKNDTLLSRTSITEIENTINRKISITDLQGTLKDIDPKSLFATADFQKGIDKEAQRAVNQFNKIQNTVDAMEMTKVSFAAETNATLRRIKYVLYSIRTKILNFFGYGNEKILAKIKDSSNTSINYLAHIGSKATVINGKIKVDGKEVVIQKINPNINLNEGRLTEAEIKERLIDPNGYKKTRDNH